MPRFSSSIISALVILLCFGCSNKDSGTRKKAAAQDDSKTGTFDLAAVDSAEDYSTEDLQKMSLGELYWLLTERWEQDRLDQEELRKTSILNQVLCEQLVHMRKSCAVIHDIMKESTADDLGCTASADQQTAEEKIKVTITYTDTKNDGPFDLVVNDIYSAQVNRGENEDVKFESLGSSKLRSIRFVDIFSAYLKMHGDTADAPMPALQGFSFKLSYGNKDIIIDPQLVISVNAPKDQAGEPKPTIYDINVTNILNARKGEACSFGLADINALKNAQNQTIANQNTAKNSELYEKREQERQAVKSLGAKEQKAKLIEMISVLRSDVAQRYSVLDGERSRLVNLTTELNMESDMGCQFQKKITELSIRISGQVTASEFGSEVLTGPRKGRSLFGTSGSIEDLARDLRIDLGGGLVFTVDSNKYLGLDDSNSAPSFMPNPLPDAILGAIDRVTLSKMTVEYQNDKVGCTSASGFIGNIIGAIYAEECYKSQEKKLMVINAIEVKANGFVIFRSTDATTLRDGNLTWSDNGTLRNSKEWGEMMLSKKCDVN